MKISVPILASLLLTNSILLFGGQPPYAYQSHQSIVAAVKNYLKEQTTALEGKTTIEVSAVDHRLRLNRCAEKLETFSPPGANTVGKTTVGVRCSSPNPWTLYLSANITNNQLVAVAVKDLHRGTVIDSDDIALAERDTSSLLRGHFVSLDEISGRTLRRTLRRDQVITPNSLVAEQTIKRGQAVTILAGNDGIQVRMKGKALRNGNPGDLIPVQNLTSKKKLEARVMSAGTVRVD